MSEFTHSSNTTVEVEMRNTIALPTCMAGEQHLLRLVPEGLDCPWCGLQVRVKL